MNAPGSSNTAHEPQLGEVFADRYRVDRLLGRGATGSVWAALDQAVGDAVALKLLVAGPDDAAERFRREVRLARRVTHRNATRIFDLGARDALLYLTMELVEGQSLETLLQQATRLTSTRSAEIAAQIARGLDAAHQVGVVHRDIKPANVLLEVGGRVVVTDFGVARAVAGDAQVTMGAVMIGSPAYMAPEQVRGQGIGPATDLYALGCVLYEMLTGQRPFVRETAVGTAMARLEAPAPDPRSIVPVPDDLAEFVLRLMHSDPELRPASSAAVAEQLEGFVGRTAPSEAAETMFATSATASTSAVSSGTAPPAPNQTGSSSTSTFVSIAPQNRTLAVLPFRSRGSDAAEEFSETLHEDLVDVLARTRGLRVTASDATFKYAGQPVDPRDAGREVQADAVVTGTARVIRDQLRVSARLVDVATGEQLWVERFDYALEAALDLQEEIAMRIAEKLRQELELLSARHRVPEEAVQLFVEAKQRAALPSTGGEETSRALELVERALAIAPDFELALAGHAALAVVRWFLPSEGSDRDISREAHDSVARALERAPDVPLTHFAAGRLAVSDGRFGDAANELTLALTMAPTFADVHGYLGSLQCEAGRGDEGERHLLLARRIDPARLVGPVLARRQALIGDREGYARSLAALKATPEAARFMVDSLEVRVAGWWNELDTVRAVNSAEHLPPGHDFRRFVEQQRAALLGETTSESLLEAMHGALRTGAGPRLDAFVHQLTVEALVPLEDIEAAMRELRVVVAAAAMVDTDWMERCPALEPLRSDPEFAELSSTVQRRADAIWRLTTS